MSHVPFDPGRNESISEYIVEDVRNAGNGRESLLLPAVGAV